MGTRERGLIGRTDGGVAVPLLALALVTAGCASAECDRERLPNQGIAVTPEVLVQIVQHEAKHECWSEMYDNLSTRTKGEHGRTAWRLGVSSIKVPEPYGYRVVDVMERGTFVGALPNPGNPGEAFVYYDYQEPGKMPLHLKLLALREGATWRVGLVDQDERIRAGRSAYWWFDD